MVSQLRNFQNECDQLREQIDLEAEGKTELQRQLSKANAEASQWRAKLESVGGERADEVEETRRKMQARVQELQDLLNEAQNKLLTAEKSRQRIQGKLTLSEDRPVLKFILSFFIKFMLYLKFFKNYRTKIFVLRLKTNSKFQ